MLSEHKPDFLAIQKTSENGIQIGDETYRESIVIVADQVQTDWSLRNITEIRDADVERLKQLPADVLLIGSGDEHAFASSKVVGALMQAGKGVECMRTDAACRTYNVLADEGRRVAALLIQ